MGSFSGLGIGLSFVFGCILMGLVAELYYLLWCKKRVSSSTTNTKTEDFSFLFCWRRRSCSFNSGSSNQEVTNSVRNPSEQEDLETGSSKNLGVKGEEGVEAELMRMHNLCGPPRFLFTIKEESKEDLESEDGKSRTKSLSDVVFAVDGTPFLTPLSSPTVKSSILSDSYNNHGFNPLFESFTEAEVNRLRSSPAPKFKFLKDAEDKLIRKLLMEEGERKIGLKNGGSVQESAIKDSGEGKDVCFVKFTNQAAQVLPLASSPTFKPVVDKKSSVQ